MSRYETGISAIARYRALVLVMYPAALTGIPGLEALPAGQRACSDAGALVACSLMLVVLGRPGSKNITKIRRVPCSG